MKHVMLYRNKVIMEIAKWLFMSMPILIVMYMNKNQPWPYDASDYWNRGIRYMQASFDMRTVVDNGFRGYLFPLVLGVCNAIGGRTAWCIISAFYFSGVFAFVIPGISERKCDGILECATDVLLEVIVIILFRGLFTNPLSDMFALCNMLIAIYMLKRVVDNTGVKRTIYAVLTGFFAYCSYNVRTIYLFAVIGMVIVYIVYIYMSIDFHKYRIKEMMIGLLSGCVGAVVAAIPQIIRNRFFYYKISMKVPTQGLMTRQLLWGLQYSRFDALYEECVKEPYINEMVVFRDGAASRILQEMEIGDALGWREYFLICIKYPIDIALIYVKHMFNMLFPGWPNIYIVSLNSVKWPYAFLAATMIFAFAYVMLERCTKDKMGIWYMIPLLMPFLFICPGAAEYRFSLPFYMFVIFELCYNTDYAKAVMVYKENKIKTWGMYLLFGMMCFALWSNMLASETTIPLLF